MVKNTIFVEFRHPRFAALLPRGELSLQSLKGDIWDSFSPLCMSTDLNSFNPPDSPYSYNGNISLELVGFEIPDIKYESTISVDVIDSHGHLVSLPTAIVRVKIELENLDQEVLDTLTWYQDCVKNIDQNIAISEMMDVIDSLLDAIIKNNNPLKILEDYERKERQFRFLTKRMQDESLQTDILVVQKSSDPLQIGRKLISALSRTFQESNLLSDEDREMVIQIINQVKTNLETNVADTESEDVALQLRLRKSLRLHAISRAIKNENNTTPSGINPDATYLFAKDLFHIIMSHWNNIIRYLKYELTQYWLEEYPIYAAGLFYIKNKVTLDGKEILPYSTAFVRQDILKHHLIDEKKWKSVTSELQDGNVFKTYQLDWTVDGILSQAFSHLVNDELPAAIILGGVALEEAMTRVLYHVNRNEYEKGGLGEKIRKVNRLIGAEAFGYNIADWKHDWKLLNAGNKNTGNGLVQIRTRIQHPEIDSEKIMISRVEVAERILASQRICRALLKWDRYQREN